MTRRPPRSTRTDSLCPYPSLVRSVQRWRQPIARNRVTAMVAQVIHLFLGCHAFSDHIEPERVGHGDHGGGNRGIIGVATEVADELLVDLQGVDRDRKSTRLNSSN